MQKVICQNQQQTEALAAAIAANSLPGDLFALSGDLGAGKSTFARAFIRAALGDQRVEVPSPTFTLVQSYEGQYVIHHTDLYRIEDPDEVYDLGLDEERTESVLLVEWPDRMPADWWTGAVTIHLERFGETTAAGDEGRALVLEGAEAQIKRLLAGVRP